MPRIDTSSLTVEWFPVVSKDDEGNELVVEMMVDAPKRPDGTRETFTPIELDGYLASMDALMSTPKLQDLRFDQCPIKNEPQPRNYAPNYGLMMTDHAVKEHSWRVDQSIKACKINEGAVGNTGKHWVCFPDCELIPGMCRIYGWHLVTTAGAWRGVPLRPSVTFPDALKVIDRVGRHQSGHWDYAMTATGVKKMATLNGELVPLAAIYISPDLCHLVSHNGVISRYGAVVEHVDVEPEKVSTAPWLDPLLSIGHRAVLWSRNEMANGVKEEPSGSNTSPRIRSYFKGVTRKMRSDGTPDPKAPERPLTLRAGKWCAAGFCSATEAVLLEGEVPPHMKRCSGVELERDALELGLWRPISLVKNGGYEPKIGDGIIYDRGGWWRHVARFVSRPSKTRMVAIGFNESDTIVESERDLFHPQLKGFIEYPPAPCEPEQDESAGVWPLMNEEVRRYLDVLDDWWRDVGEYLARVEVPEDD